jgi:hypothetical protein
VARKSSNKAHNGSASLGEQKVTRGEGGETHQTSGATRLFEKAGIAAELDAGCVELRAAQDAAGLVETCRKLRFWDRAEKMKQV